MKTPESCPRIEALSALVDGELPEQEGFEVQAHAAGCALCAAWLGECRRLHVVFAHLDAATPEFDVAPEVDRRIGGGRKTRRPGAPHARRPARLRWWQVALLAPGGALAVSAGLWMGAALMPAALPRVHPVALKMVPFSAVPAGALCPVPQACKGTAQ